MRSHAWRRKAFGVASILVVATAFCTYRLLEVPAENDWEVVLSWSRMIGIWCCTAFFVYLRERERRHPDAEYIVLPGYIWLLFVAFLTFLVVTILENRLSTPVGIGLNLLATVLVFVATTLMLRELESPSSANAA